MIWLGMSRPLRIEYPGAWYHVMNRGLNRRLIFSGKKDYPLFLETLADACSLFHVGIGAYCLLPNNYHLLVHTPEANLSRFMRHVNGVYTQRFNRRHKRDGPLFRGRFKGILIEADSYLLQVVKYIHRNPAKAGLTESLGGFAWSSHKYFTASPGKNVPDWLESDCILGHFSERRTQAVSGYKAFMRQEIIEEVANFYAKKYQGPILGEKIFAEKIKEKYIGGDRELNLEVKGERAIRGWTKVRLINKEVCREFKIAEKSLYHSRRGEENLPRQIALSLARELSGLSYAELADAYKAKTGKTIATSVFRFKYEAKKRKDLAKQYSQIKSRCSHEKI